MTVTFTLKRLIGILISSVVVLGGAVMTKPELGDKTIDVHLDKDGIKITKSETSIENKE